MGVHNHYKRLAVLEAQQYAMQMNDGMYCREGHLGMDSSSTKINNHRMDAASIGFGAKTKRNVEDLDSVQHRTNIECTGRRR